MDHGTHLNMSLNVCGLIDLRNHTSRFADNVCAARQDDDQADAPDVNDFHLLYGPQDPARRWDRRKQAKIYGYIG
jgi:hypothetical protein